MESETKQEKMDQPKSGDAMTKIAVVLIIILLGFAAYVLFFKPTGSVVLDNYKYSNGQDEFDVQKVSDIQTYITLEVGDDKTL